MPREPKPWYRSRDDAWYVQVNKKQVFLAHGKVNKQSALDAYYELMAKEGRTPPKDMRVAELALLFKEWGRENLAESTWEWYRGHLQSFLDHKDGAYGQLKVSQLTENHIDAWLRARKVGPSTRRGAITALKRLLSWGIKKRRIAENPLKDMERPEMGRRRPLTPAEFEAIFAAVSDQEFRDVLTALRLTGARPAEVAGVTATDVHGDVWLLEEHKTRGKTGKPRVIYLNAEMVELTAKLMGKNPTGPLFRNTDGNRWTRNAIRCRFRNLRKKLGLEAGVVCYGLRHAFVTDALERGVPIATLAEIVGHSDTKMISAVYSHLNERREHLRKAVEQATASK
jgi:site-specific recombinase XerD